MKGIFFFLGTDCLGLENVAWLVEAPSKGNQKVSKLIKGFLIFINDGVSVTFIRVHE